MNFFQRISLAIFTIFLFSNSSIFAQNYVEIGSGSTANTMPIYSSWNYSWSSLIYNHADLGTAKTITKIALNCTNGPKTITNQKVYMKLGSNDIFATANYEDPLNNGYTLVFQGNLTFQTGWNEIILTTPMVYDGVQNLIIHWENRWGTSYGPQFQSTPSTINNNKNCGNDVNFPAPSQTGYLNPFPSSLTNMRFYYASTGPATPTNPIPAHNSTNISVDTDLTWTLGANTTTYDLYLGPDPANLPLVASNVTSVNGVNTYTVPGLLADSASHYWKVIAKNGTQAESSPIWKFKTEYVIDQFPYNEGFEDSLVFHTYPVTSAWTILPDVSWYEYNVNPHSGLLCAKSSFFITGNTGTLRSPKVILPPGYSISFWWQNTSVNKVASHDTTYFEITTNGGNTWTKLTYLSPASQNTQYVQVIQDLTSYAGNNVFFRFRRITDNTSSACNLYLDDISIYQTGITPTLSVTPSNQNVTAPAGNTTFTVNSNSAWTVSSDQSWCTVTPSGNGNGLITANYSENTSSLTRIAHITVTVTGLTPIAVTVTQSGSGTVATLSVTPANQNVSASSGTVNFSVSSNSVWSASSNQSWCSVTPSGSNNGTIVANFTENTTLVQRVAEITVTVIGLTPIVVTVTQSAAVATLAVTPSNQNVSAALGNTSFSVTSNTAWTSSSNQNWCVVTASGTGNGVIVADYQENTSLVSRVATISITVAGLSPINVTVTQEAAIPFLSATPLNQDVTSAAGTTNFTINTNLSWTAISDAGWCSVTSSGSGAGTLFATYAENTVAATRIAHITVSASGVSSISLTVTQIGPGAILTVTPLIQTVNYQAGIATYAVTSNASWTAISDASWCIPTPSGTGSAVLNAAYGQNETMVERIAHITVSAPGMPSVILQLVQHPSFVNINDAGISILKIFPNPAKDVLNVRFSELSKGTVLKIYNYLGELQMQQDVMSTDFKLDVSSLKKGTYIFQIEANDIKYSRKIVII